MAGNSKTPRLTNAAVKALGIAFIQPPPGKSPFTVANLRFATPVMCLFISTVLHDILIDKS
jgi:hypothetical protein